VGLAAIDEREKKKKKKKRRKIFFCGRRYFDVSLLVALIPCKIR
jgi:hypothetical protein